MDVAVILDPEFQGETGPAVWIIDTQGNRAWFENQHGLDPNSAIFSVERYATADEAVVQTIWNAQEHHPSWDSLRVIGAAPTPVILADLRAGGQVFPTSTGFLLVRS